MAYVSDTQHRLLHILNADVDEYSVIFTTGFTAGYRLFAEIYPFRKGSVLLTLLDNHESVKHVIASLALQGGHCCIAPLKEQELVISSTELKRLLRQRKEACGSGGIFIYPAQSCLSGIRHSLNWIKEAQTREWQVLLDVSTYLPTGSLDLSIHKPEFVLGSLHHMLGYPSGMGFLLVKKQAFSVVKGLQSLQLLKPSAANLDEVSDCHVVSEDDNINLLSFAALSFGLLHLESVGLIPIQKRVLSLTSWLTQMLKSLRHKDEETQLLQVKHLFYPCQIKRKKKLNCLCCIWFIAVR
jgi:molybdenum cofactor sulfurtransferase